MDIKDLKPDTQFITTDIWNYLDQLKPDQKPLWGKMSAQHMVEHLMMLFNVSNGVVTLDLTVPEEMCNKLRRHTFQYKNPFPKNLRVGIIPEKPAPCLYETFEESKAKLKEAIDIFHSYFEADPEAMTTHPLLGDLNYTGWICFQTKHTSHHFSQFGLMEGEITPW